MRVPLLPAFALALLSACPAGAAELWTYRGTIGKSPVILEVTQALADGRIEGRYAYLSRGIDIPLHSTADDTASFVVKEEAPCKPGLCQSAGSGDQDPPPPIAAEWRVQYEDEADRITGTWKDLKTGKTLPVTLSFTGTRLLDNDPTVGYDLVVDYLPPEKTAEDFPYEFEKMKGPFAAGEVQELDGGSYRIDEDKRIGIGYPVIESLAGGGDTGPINDWLTARRIALSVPDYACASRRYQSFQWDEQSGIGDDYQSESSARLDFLSDRLAGVSEGGSFFCGGAHPDNFSRYQLGDVATGKSVAPESLLKDFTFQDYNGQPLDPAKATEDNPGRYVPSEALIARVTRDWKPDSRVTDSGCEMPQLIHDNLSVAFKGSDLVFVLKDLPNYAAACGDDLYAIPLSEAGDLLNRKGKRYFSE